MNKIGADYVGLLVLGVFNAAIGRLNIRSDFVYQPLVRGCRKSGGACSAALQSPTVAAWRGSMMPLAALHRGVGLQSGLMLLQGNSWASQKRPEHVIEEGSDILFTVHE